MNRGLAQLAVVSVAIAATSFPSFGQQAPTYVAPYVPFDEIFFAEDTLTLDPEILIGQVQSLDISDTGAMVLVDNVAQAIHLFTATGSHVAQLNIEDCFPESGAPWSARFVGKDRIVANDTGGTYSVFDSTGKCIVAKRRSELVSTTGFCGVEDSLFVFRSFTQNPSLLVLTPDLELAREVSLRAPKFRLLSNQSLPSPGRSIGCFETGPRYIYPESPDAVSAQSQDEPHNVPVFYKDRDKDLSMDTNPMKRVGEIMEYIITFGVYELYDSAHIVAYMGTWKTRFKNQRGLGLLIVDHTRPESAVSTFADIHLKAAKDGLVYAMGEHEERPDGTVDNPVIIRYRYRQQ